MADEDKKDEKEDKAPPFESKDKETTEDTSEPESKEPESKDQNMEQLDADAIIDAFLESNPDLVDVPVEEWPEETIEMLRDTFNTEHVDAPNGVLPEKENEAGEPIDPPAPVEEAATKSLNNEGDPEGGIDESVPDPEQDFDIAELSKLVEAGDKDGAWAMLQNMFGVTPDQSSGPTNALEKMTPPGNSGSNALAKIISGLKF
jgi:hypothetical protein